MSDDRPAAPAVGRARYAGIDPGLHGGIAFLDEEGRAVELLATPLVKASGRGRDDYDEDAIAAIFRTRADARRQDRGLFVMIERLDPMPVQFAKKGQKKGEAGANVSGVIVNHHRGQARRGWSMMLAAFRIPRQLVLPQVWQRAMLRGTNPGLTTKQRAITAAKRMFPSVCLVCGAVGAHAPHPRRTKEQDGFADALLMAAHGRSLHLGGELFAQQPRRKMQVPTQ